ncbi:MAG TPA: hypothetical protein VM433_11725 [Mycobacteriales bacterium]|nr:hypothetical protein [Mycobacteriales bacterium]
MLVRIPSFRLLAVTTGLAALAAGTAGAAAGVQVAGVGLDLDAVRTYAHLHGFQPDISSRLAAEAAVAGATPRAECGLGSNPETGRQGRVPLSEYVDGRAREGYTCNTEQVGRLGESGGFQVHRYVDAAGRECAYFDSTLLFPVKDVRKGVVGTTVLDMSDPANPVKTASLVTPAMDSPHESLRLNAERGLLVAGMGSPATHVGFVDVYDVSADCRQPVLKASLPVGGLGHEGGFSPDGMTYWVTTTARPGIQAIDLSNPSLPTPVWRTDAHTVHGMSFSADGNRAYLADNGRGGLTILDVSEIQARKAGATARVVSTLSWPEVSIPQNSNPVTIGGKPFLIEYDEYASGNRVGAARIIDISDETAPKVVSQLRLEVHQPEARADQSGDPGANLPVQGYAAHYCNVPREVEPGIVACSMIVSGLRVFDIRDPYNPREIAYFNQPAVDAETPLERGAWAMSAPAFAPERDEIWYSDGNTGFFSVRLTNGVWPKDEVAEPEPEPAAAPGRSGGKSKAGRPGR